MAFRTGEWRLRTRTGQELTVTAGGAARAGDAVTDDELPYPLEFIPADLEAWLTGPDAWSRQVLIEMYEALGGPAWDGDGDGGARAVLPALVEGFERGELRARARPPGWRLPPAAADVVQPDPAGEPDARDTPAVPAAAAREQRRISVRLGDLDAVFEPVATAHGKRQRLQALGHYYERFTAGTGNAATEAFDNCLAYWRAKRERARGRPFADDGELEADLQDQIRRFIVAGGALPALRSEVRIRLPGAVTCEGLAELDSAGVPDGRPLPSVRFDREAEMWDGNGALGKIPIVARIEVRRNGRWVAAAGEQVCFQLVPPFHDDPGAELADVRSQRATSQRPAARGWTEGAPENAGPRQFLTEHLAHAFDESDPQRYNAHVSRGGKRGQAVLGSIFDRLPAPAFPDMSAPEAAPAPRAHAIRAATNAAGEAGVLLLPARTAGDRYRLRIFLDPNDGVASDGTERDAVSFETGRLCVWRHILWSTYLAKPAPSYPPADSIAGVQARLATLGYDVGEIDGVAGERTVEAVRGFQRAHHPLPENGDPGHGPTRDEIERTVRDYVNGGEAYSGFGPPIAAPRFATATAELGKMYCELEIEPAAASGGSLLTPELHREALRWAIREVDALPPATFGLAVPFDVSAMFSEEFETPFLFEIRHPRHYNRLRRPGFQAAGASPRSARYWQGAAEILAQETHGLLRQFLRYLTGGGSPASPPGAGLTGYSTPGLTVVNALSASRLTNRLHEHGQVEVAKKVVRGERGRNSGYTYWDRASVVFGGQQLHARSRIYRDDNFTKTIMHEMGHALLLRHQFTAADTPLHPDSCREDHHSPTAIVNPKTVPGPVAYDRCLMGYAPCEGELCGKCHLKLRGWDISRMPT